MTINEKQELVKPVVHAHWIQAEDACGCTIFMSALHAKKSNF